MGPSDKLLECTTTIQITDPWILRTEASPLVTENSLDSYAMHSKFIYWRSLTLNDLRHFFLTLFLKRCVYFQKLKNHSIRPKHTKPTILSNFGPNLSYGRIKCR